MMHSREDTSFASSSEDEICDWDQFIWDNKGIPAPSEAFYQPNYVPVNNLMKGQIIMAKDDRTSLPGLFVARIESTYKCLVQVNIVEVNHKFWTMCDSDRISPFNETQIRRHPNNTRTDKAWEKWLTKFMEQNNSFLAKSELLIELDEQYSPKKNLFEVGMVLAYLDQQFFTGKMSPAIVTEVLRNGQITLTLADRGFKTEVTLPYYDRRIFSISFTKDIGISTRNPHKTNKRKGSLVKISPSLIKQPRMSAGMDISIEVKRKGRPKMDKVSRRGRPRGSKDKGPRKKIEPSLKMDVTPDISFHPGRASTPVSSPSLDEILIKNQMDVEREQLDISAGSVITVDVSDVTIHLGSFNTDIVSTSIKTNDSQMDSVSFINNQTHTLQMPIYHNIPEKPISEDKVDNSDSMKLSPLPNMCEIQDDISLQTKPSVPYISTFDLQIINIPFASLENLWLNTCFPHICKEVSTNEIERILYARKEDSCKAVVNQDVDAGPLINKTILVKEVLDLPSVHFQLQYYNILVTLTKCGYSPKAVFDRMGFRTLLEADQFYVYADVDGNIKGKSFPRPRDYNNACGWLKYFLRQLKANENLISLHEDR